MYFEGAEKKIELVSRGAAFRGRPESFWHALVDVAGAKILSKVSSDRCDAYLLSESSLFVWDDRVTMITCGRTTLARAVLFLCDQVNPGHIDFFSYQRKNEYFPHLQETDFFRDIEQLRGIVPGKAFRFGTPDEHHVNLYHLDKPFRPEGAESTLEILMYNLQGRANEIFSCNQTIERVREIIKLEAVFPDFVIDDHLFDPCGYSLNAVRGSDYYTIHVTPEDVGSYVSFETNVRLGNRKATVMRSVVDVFQPRSFDVVYFHPERELPPFDVPPFVQRGFTRESLSCGFEVGFSSYYLPVTEPLRAVPLDI
ncbi:MAG TPA: adenosylmethionine decarboxylase [Bdellovibrionales bacterium]|nr:adenosylmethionine decarboxylase [Bdellovibrionales bacterium]